MIPFIPQHRFRIAKGKCPLIQIGPGLLTLNETDSYVWDSFKPRCESVVKSLFDAYPQSESLNIQSLTLRYVNAVEIEVVGEDVISFLKDSMNTHIILPPALLEDKKFSQHANNINLQISFSHQELGIVVLQIALGQLKNKPALIWDTHIQSVPRSLPDMKEFSPWLEKAHAIAYEWFFKLIEGGNLERRFVND